MNSNYVKCFYFIRGVCNINFGDMILVNSFREVLEYRFYYYFINKVNEDLRIYLREFFRCGRVSI